MGQQEVYDFLLKNPDQWYTSKQISEKLIVSIGSVTMSLKKLRKTNIIKYRNTGKRNTFQYMVQSEPARLAERKTPMIELTTGPAMQEAKIKVKIKPKVVHQHTYLGGQTFYGVIRPKEEVEAMERQRDEKEMPIEAHVKRVTRKKVTRPTRKKTVHKRITRVKTKKAKTRKVVRRTAKTTKKRGKR